MEAEPGRDAHLVIRDATPEDRAWLRAAVVELQEHERRLHPTRLPGEAIADAYLAWMMQQASMRGSVLIALAEGAFAGFVAGWVEEDECLAETADSNRYGLICDICVLTPFRGRRIAAKLLDFDRATARAARRISHPHRRTRGEPLGARKLRTRGLRPL